jgi:hypothetical protein
LQNTIITFTEYASKSIESDLGWAQDDNRAAHCANTAPLHNPAIIVHRFRFTGIRTCSKDKRIAQKEMRQIDSTLSCAIMKTTSSTPLANQQIRIDLDDGVKANYEKLGMR